MCGAQVAPRAEESRRASPQADHETVRFVRAVVSRPATFTFTFLVANVFLYLLMELAGGATGNVLLAYGAKLNFLIDERGEWWRFITPIFLHVKMPGLIGPLHLLANMYGLFILGPYVEKLYGSAKFVVFWVATGVAGVAASYLSVRPELATGPVGRFLFKAFDVPSAGASGALFGLVGVLFVFGIKYRHELPEGLKRAFGFGMMPIILINVFIGYAGSGFIDNAAHMGGLVTGMALALLVDYKRPGERGHVAYIWHFLQAASLVLIVMSFGMVALNFNKSLPAWEPPGDERAHIISYVEATNAGQAAVVNFVQGRESDLQGAIGKLEAAPVLNERAGALRTELKALVERGRELAGEKDADARERGKAKLEEDFLAWEKRFDEWVKTDGENFGIRLKPTPDEKPPDGNR